MNMFIFKGRLARRILVNYRADPEVVRPLLPAPFEPLLEAGRAVVGLCLIRLEALRPLGLPRALGLSSENAAHRIAVRRPGGTGVFVLRRDSPSLVAVAAGGRLFPGVHGRASLEVEERGQLRRVAMRTADGAGDVRVEVRPVERPAVGSLFPDVDAASRFFRTGAVGFSRGHRPDRLEGMELRLHGWNLAPLEVLRLESAFYDDRERFPAGSIEFDSAFLMTGLDHEWRPCDAPLSAAAAGRPAACGSAAGP
jgi:hypothetical protein